MTAPKYLLGEYLLEADSRLLSRAGAPVHLAHRPLQVLLYLIENRDRMIARAELLARFWEGREVYDVALSKCIGAIRKALGDSPEQPRFIETRWAEGYRYIGPLEEQWIESAAGVVEIERTRGVRVVIEEEVSADERSPESSEVQLPEPAARALPSARRMWVVMWAVALVGTLLVAGALLVVFRRHRPASEPPRSVAVLPFKNLSGDAGQDYFSDGLTESLLNELSRVRELKVIGRTSAFTFKNKEVDAREVGQKLGVAYLLEGSVRREGGQVQVTARLVSTADGRVVWTGNSFTRPVKDAIALQNEIGCSVAANLRAVLCGDPAHKPGTQNPEAFDAYLRATQFRRVYEVEKAIAAFDKAVRLDPNYALAWAGLADAWTIMEVNHHVPPLAAAPKARDCAARAMAIDDSLAAPYAALGLLTSFSDRNWAEGNRYFQQALQRNPNHALAHAWYGGSLLAQGKFAEAETAMLRAQELDPLSMSIANSLAEAYYYSRRPERCLAVASKGMGLTANDDWANLNLYKCYCMQGRYDEARQAAHKIKDPALQAPLQAGLLARQGQADELRRLTEQLAAGDQGRISPYSIAELYALIGDAEQAFAWLRKSADQQEANLVSLKIDPAFDSLRQDPRFAEMLRRAGLPE